MLELDRRQFCLAAGMGFLSALSANGRERFEETSSLLASAYRDEYGKYGIALFSDRGDIVWQAALPGRGHAIVADKGAPYSVVFARRPGNFAVAFDPAKQKRQVLFHSPSNRHFYGHGTFSSDGNLLFATENDFENALGKIGIYSVRDGFARIGEFESHGTGPHDIKLLDDGTTLCIANGGIETHPDFPRTKLNLPTMQPSIVYMDAGVGSLIEKHTLPPNLHKVSTRHMDVAEDGQVWIGCQYEGARADLPPLIVRLRMGEKLAFVELPEKVTKRLANYVGSICASHDRKRIMATSPKGNSAVLLDAVDGDVISVTEKLAVCGVTSSRNGWALSSMNGELNGRTTSLHWDNHLKSVQI
ncbi:MAG: DUF1513 domain-containing protein [Pseudomonadota bacterium]